MAIDPIREHTLPKERIQPHVKVNPAITPGQRLHPDARNQAVTRDRLGLIATLVLCTAIAILLVSRYASLVTGNIALQNMQTTLSHQQTREAALQSIVFELSSPTRILNIAEHTLKMTPATPVIVGTNSH